MPTTPVEAIVPGVWRFVVPLSRASMATANGYLVSAGRAYTLIDGGLDDELGSEALTRALHALGANQSMIERVVVTHGHRDHFGAGSRLQRDHGTEIWLHEADATYIPSRYGADYHARLRRFLEQHGMEEHDAASVAESLAVAADTPLPRPDRLLRDGDVVAGGIELEVIWTPGHTPGHVCLFVRDAGIVISGDHVLPEWNPNVSQHVDSQSSPMSSYLSSLERIARFEARTALPGHGPTIPALAARANELLAHQRARSQRLQVLLDGRPRSAVELVREIWVRPSVVPNIRRNEVATIAAHLEMLVEQGQAHRVRDAGRIMYAAA